MALALLLAGLAAAEDFDDRMKRGLDALSRGDAIRAELELKKAVALSPDNADARVALALAYTIGHNRSRALDEYKRALGLDRRYVEGRKFVEVARQERWIKRPPEQWEAEQRNLALEAFNEPEGARASARQASNAIRIFFPPDWEVDRGVARPLMIGSHATLTVTGGQDALGAIDAFDWLEKTMKAEPARYGSAKILENRGFGRQGSTGVRAVYVRRVKRYRQPLKALDVVLLKGGQFRRAVYEAPLSEFDVHLGVAEASINTLQF